MLQFILKTKILWKHMSEQTSSRTFKYILLTVFGFVILIFSVWIHAGSWVDKQSLSKLDPKASQSIPCPDVLKDDPHLTSYQTSEIFGKTRFTNEEQASDRAHLGCFNYTSVFKIIPVASYLAGFTLLGIVGHDILKQRRKTDG